MENISTCSRLNWISFFVLFDELYKKFWRLDCTQKVVYLCNMAQHRTNMPQVNTPLLWFLFWVRNPLHIVATQLSRRPVSLYWPRRYWESAGDMFLERESTQKLAINIVLIMCYGCLTLHTFGTECIRFQLLLLFVPGRCTSIHEVWEI